jgi:NitT/TauT family transport system ATP-binding protein
MPILDMQQVSYTYPGWPTIVKQVDWSIMPGEFHCLVGRSGCGKTTLLKLAAGLLQPQQGRVTVQGQAALAPGAGTSFVFQSPTLLDWLTVLDNVLLPIALHRTPLALERDRALHLLDKMGLSTHLRHFPRQLSGGQQSRVAIARALVTQPAILLMDEPFAALDAMTREELQDVLLAICQEQASSVFFVTHDISEAVYLADRVAVMTAGHLHGDLRIKLPKPRVQAMRYSAGFNDICAELRASMDRAAP